VHERPLLQVRVFVFKAHILNHCILYNTVYKLYIFLLCRLNKPCEGAMNVRLVLGLLAWLQTVHANWLNYINNLCIY
jgi:hypothetical protein